MPKSKSILPSSLWKRDKKGAHTQLVGRAKRLFCIKLSLSFWQPQQLSWMLYAHYYVDSCVKSARTLFQLVIPKQPICSNHKIMLYYDYMCVWTFGSLTSVSFPWKSNVFLRILLDRWMREKFLMLINHLHHSGWVVLLQTKHQVETSSETCTHNIQAKSQHLHTAFATFGINKRSLSGSVKPRLIETTPWRFVDWSLGFHLNPFAWSNLFVSRWSSRLHTFGQGEEMRRTSLCWVKLS